MSEVPLQRAGVVVYEFLDLLDAPRPDYEGGTPVTQVTLRDEELRGGLAALAAGEALPATSFSLLYYSQP
jgi:hypothetical protein